MKKLEHFVTDQMQIVTDQMQIVTDQMQIVNIAGGGGEVVLTFIFWHIDKDRFQKKHVKDQRGCWVCLLGGFAGLLCCVYIDFGCTRPLLGPGVPPVHQLVDI